MTDRLKKVVITGGAGRIGQQLLLQIAQGLLFGLNQPISLSILEQTHNLEKCRGIKLELDDCLFPLLKGFNFTDKPEIAFLEADLVFFLGAKKSANPLNREPTLIGNWSSLQKQAWALNKVAHSHVLSIVIANPCNTNAYVLLKNAPSIPPQNFHALSYIDLHRARQIISNKQQLHHDQIKNVIVWGNHSSTVVADYSHASLDNELLNHKFSEDVFVECRKVVQGRGQEVTNAYDGVSSCLSPAYLAIQCARALLFPNFNDLNDSFFCSSFYSRGNPYGFDDDLIFSMPCITKKEGVYTIPEKYMPDKKLADDIRASEAELIHERELYKKKF